jgi:TonB family protein
VVTVRLNLDADGIPHDMKVVKGLRSDLDKKAIEAVSKWRFTPAIKDGKPTAVSVNVQVAFRLY